ncbi:NIP1 [Arabidopsis thaliana]|uniref:NIP1 n=1 Tax=Arabidopsis thaliana TaxID=3702 RepID=A0A178VWZ9_ARATH|nr:NIP1 [Arabidopsis thaliana]
MMIARFVLSILIVAAIVSGSEFSDTRDAKVEKILKKLNKPALKSIKYAQIQAKGKFHGAHADINVWKPFVQTPKEFSLAQMWVMAGPFSEVNSVEAGWQVYQDRYGDDNPRYFIFWTADGYHSGCYNLDCQGFVPVSHKFALGAAVSNVSTFDGQQYHISTTIWKDPNSGNWWLKFGDEFVGYWPSILFNHLKDGATEIQWGGEIINFKDGALHTTTRMGSGHFAEAGYQKASYFKDLEIIDERDIHSSPKEGYSYMTQESCYNIRSGYAKVWGVYFYYGGPGRNQNCQ